jgi:hypothetical protein
MKQIYPVIAFIFLASCTINIGTDDDKNEKKEEPKVIPKPQKPKWQPGKTASEPVLFSNSTTLSVSIGKSLVFNAPVGYKVLNEVERKELHNKGVEATGGVVPIINPLRYAAKKNESNAILITSNIDFTQNEMDKREKMNEVLRGAADAYESLGMDIETSTSVTTINGVQYRSKTIKLFKGINKDLVLTQELYLAFVGNSLVNITLSYNNAKDKNTMRKVLNTMRVENTKIKPLITPKTN